MKVAERVRLPFKELRTGQWSRSICFSFRFFFGDENTTDLKRTRGPAVSFFWVFLSNLWKLVTSTKVLSQPTGAPCRADTSGILRGGRHQSPHVRFPYSPSQKLCSQSIGWWVCNPPGSHLHSTSKSPIPWLLIMRSLQSTNMCSVQCTHNPASAQDMHVWQRLVSMYSA